MAKIITLLTDFGSRDPYVGEMKGIILGIYPDVHLIDLTHEIPAQDVVAGAYALRRAVDAFPTGTIHVAIVDPGVGSSRKSLLLCAGGHFLLGPDNGLLVGAASALDGEPQAFLLENKSYQRASVSAVFHGRDIFAPAAAHLARGVAPEDFGRPFDEPVWLPKPSLVVRENSIEGEITLVDRFGNLMTSLPANALPSRDVDIVVGGITLHGIKTTYSDVSPGVLLALVGSDGHIEIAVRDGSAQARLPDVKRGTSCRLTW